MQFENISQYVQYLRPPPKFEPAMLMPLCNRAEAKRVLQEQSDTDPSELQYLLEYYSLVREGKTNYISTNTFHDVTGAHPMEPPDFFKTYATEFRPKHVEKKRKTNGK